MALLLASIRHAQTISNWPLFKTYLSITNLDLIVLLFVSSLTFLVRTTLMHMTMNHMNILYSNMPLTGLQRHKIEQIFL